MAAHQVPSSLGFSKQEQWSGLPFPSPMHEYGRGCRPDPDLAQPRPPPPTHLLALVKTDSRAPGDPQPCLSPTQTSKEGGNLHPAGRAGWPKGYPLPRVSRQAPDSPVRGEPQVNCQHTLSTRVSRTLHHTLLGHKRAFEGLSSHTTPNPRLPYVEI